MDRTALLPQRFHKEVNYHQKEKRRKGSFKVAQEQLPRSKGNYEEDKKDQERCSQLIHGRNFTLLEVVVQMFRQDDSQSVALHLS